MLDYGLSRLVMGLCFVGVWKFGLFSGWSYELLPTLQYGLVCAAYLIAAVNFGFGIKKPKKVRINN